LVIEPFSKLLGWVWLFFSARHWADGPHPSTLDLPIQDSGRTVVSPFARTRITFRIQNFHPPSSLAGNTHMMKKIFSIAFLLAPFFVAAQQLKIQLTDFSTGFDRPVDIAHCGDSRLFVVEQDGLIWVLDSLGTRLDTFLNIDPRVNSSGNEQGLLGLAFHPNYAQNGWFFVNYTQNNGGDTRVSRFSVKPNNPNEADPNSELTILEADQPYSNHNGGCIKFGPNDGYLYIALGDGGSGGDPQNNGQKKNTFLGKILRIDVDSSNQAVRYIVPADNPFVGNSDYYPEIWSLGWRNPWRFSFDRLTGDLWAGDVGQNVVEEIDFQAAGVGGLNYGWRCYEGNQGYNTSNCQPANTYVGPIYTYPHSTGGCSVTGGFVYRGTQYPDMVGAYLFADYCNGLVWATRRNPNGTFTTTQLANLSDYEYSSFGEDRNGELYVTLLGSGKVQKVRELCSAFQISGTASEAVCDSSFSGTIFLDAVGGTSPVNFAWSNGSNNEDIVYLNPGTYIVVATSGNGCIKRDTFSIANASPAAPQVLASTSTICAENQDFTVTAQNLPDPCNVYWYKNGDFLNIVTDVTGGSATRAGIGPGNYTARVFANECLSLSSVPAVVALENQPPIVLYNSNDTLFATFIPGATYAWSLFGQPIAGETGHFIVLEQITGAFVVQVTTPAGCTGTAEIVFFSTKTPSDVRRFTLAPNPAEDTTMVEIELENPARVRLSLADSSQRQVLTQSAEGQKNFVPLDLRNLPAGTYFLTVQTPAGSFVRKLVKEF
jgi:glucose/arabinose dehydrogenase